MKKGREMSRGTGNYYEDILNQYQKGFNLLQKVDFIQRKTIHDDLENSLTEEEDYVPRGRGKLLKFLLENDSVLIKDIVLALDIRPSSISQLIGKLEHRSLVQRVVDKDDKRARRISLTEKGRVLAERIEDLHAGVSKNILDGLTPEEQQQLSGLLKKLNTSLKEKVEASEKARQE